MLTAAANDLLCRVGPGTPMGNLMREYWIPACMSSELKSDGEPMRLMLLGEQLIAFRDTDGKVGIIASGGLSHFVVDEKLDRGFLDMLKRNDGEAIQNLPRKLLNSGSSEIRNWICVAGAVEHLSLEWSLYEPGYRTPAGTGTGLGFAFWS